MDKTDVNVEQKPRVPSLGMSGLVLLSIANEGLGRVHEFAYKRMVERMYRQGETRESLLQKVERLPIPAGAKDVVARHVESFGEEPPAIEVESTVEDV
ncbi:MAG: hypothetical protein IKF14_15940 [Atopobiaceae bacterium]|nr:hypothetical protein [Atopobiaceae bacterium]